MARALKKDMTPRPVQRAKARVRCACRRAFSRCSKPVRSVAARARSSSIHARLVTARASTKNQKRWRSRFHRAWIPMTAFAFLAKARRAPMVVRRVICTSWCSSSRMPCSNAMRLICIVKCRFRFQRRLWVANLKSPHLMARHC